MTAPRGLTPEEQAAWAKLAESVTPLDPRKPASPTATNAGAQAEPVGSARARPLQPVRAMPRNVAPEKRPASQTAGLDSNWDRRLKTGSITPDFTLDLHGHGLDAAHSRLMRGMAQARAMGARTVLVISGKPRPVDPADRGTRRGAIRAKLLDWLAASEHHDAIAAIRKAHRQHGGDGALYVVLKRVR